MPRIEAYTASANPEMLELCSLLVSRQGPEVTHLIDCDPKRRTTRKGSLANLVEHGRGDFFWLVDDDDYIDPGFLMRVLPLVGPGHAGEIPRRSYHAGGSFGVSVSPHRTALFATFTVFPDASRARVAASLRGDGFQWLGVGPLSSDLIVMRGFMRDRQRAITRGKNIDGYPTTDPGNARLRRWLAEDREALALYLALTD